MKDQQTTTRFRNWSVVLVATAAFAGGYWALAANGKNDSSSRAPVEIKVDHAPIELDAENALSFSPIVKQVTPSVVKVVTREEAKIIESRGMSPFFDDPFFRRFFGPVIPDSRGGPQMRQPERVGIGSGVIVSTDGYILTNNHVVEDADEVIVTLSDGREENAKVIATDPKTDIAVIKVELDGLPAITFGESETVEVGDRVLAIGNPFGIGQTVTSGIVSATGRSLPMGIEYADFIQTDAAINRGNSGGALVDMGGRLIGINTLIYSQSGGFQGVGFAIPSDMARNVMNSLVQYGKVTRGYLGVGIQAMTPVLARELDVSSDTKGAIVTQIVPDGPSANSDLREDDIIIEFNGKKVEDARQLKFAVADSKPGSEVPVRVLRDGEELELNVELGNLPGESEVAGGPSGTGGYDEGVLDDVGVADLTPNVRRQFRIPEHVDGAVVTQVQNAAAARAGLRPGDVIQEINREPVHSAQDAIDLTRDFGDGTTLLRVWRRYPDGQSGVQYLVVDESDRDN